MRVFQNVEELEASVGTEIGTTEWRTITQEQVNQFADATDDHQWIHVDSVRAAAGPFGRTIAHGFLTLALTSGFLDELYRVEGVGMSINYGLDKVRFPTPVPVGSRVRATAVLTATERVSLGVRCSIRVETSIEGGSKPACVAEAVTLLVAAG